MFNNIGGKIKALAQVVCWIGIIASVMIGFAYMTIGDEETTIGFFIMILGSLLSWVGSFMTYGFGQLIENSDILVSQNMQLQMGNSGMYRTDKRQWICNRCKNIVYGEICPTCNKDKLDTINKWKQDGLITEEEYYQKLETIKNEQR